LSFLVNLKYLRVTVVFRIIIFSPHPVSMVTSEQINGGAASSLTNGSAARHADEIECDVLIVGAGFGGVYLLHKLRDEHGLNVKVFEAGADLGGIWHWNSYPGARVDSPVPVYEYSLPKIWKTWTWTEKYPGWQELRKYFDHVDEQLDIRKDVSFGCTVNEATYNKETNQWTMKTENGKVARSKYLIIATGFAAKRYFPDWKGLDKFKGEMHHSSYWPQGGVDVAGKKVAIVGTGATGIQMSQEIAKTAGELTVFIRTPNLCLPMKQRKMTATEQEKRKELYEDLFKERLNTFAGFPYTFLDQRTLLDSPDERGKFFEYLWERGGFNFWLGTYKDAYSSDPANREHVS
jgi:cation diffusion facilitator CzcD-associated flavoprotein CzcO